MARVIPLSGPIGFVINAKDVRAELKKAKGGPVEFHVNSPGGFVFEGIEIFNLIRDYPGHTEARITGIAASAMSYVVLAADKVSAYDNASFMIHNALALVIGNHNDMRKTADRLESLTNLLAKAYVNKTGKSLADIKTLMDDETFLFGDEMLHEGFVDEIIENPNDGEQEQDKDAALVIARASIESCLNKMRESEAANVDFERAVAYLDAMSLLLNDPQIEATTDIDDCAANHAADLAAYYNIEYATAKPFNPEAPFPNEHACRVRSPGEFQKGSFRRISRKADGKTLDIIIGRLKGKTTTTTQAFRYPKDEWTVAQARKHCTDNDGKLFEPATDTNSSGGGCGGGT